ncbi:MAG: hypothetical protein EA425_16960 [Puniceicoccaceae bacterium]|nr:MAG: hypothetical protein EA425_16960 [Puniceicoccaceae bacterium]
MLPAPFAKFRRLLPLSLMLPVLDFTAQAEPIWIEAEAAEERPAAASIGAWNEADLLSAGRALMVFLEPAQAERQIPETGLILRYTFEAAQSGPHELWNRVGLENVRSPFEWRVNGGSWTANNPEDHPSIDVVETAFWNPIGWTRMGEAELTAGSNTLEIRLTRRTGSNDRGEVRTLPVRYVSDALVVSPEPFVPNHHHRPDSTAWRTDREDRAAAQVFSLPTAAPGERASVDLDGLWQFAAWDEQGPIDEASRPRGVATLPELDRLHWYALEVPGDRNRGLPQFAFNHRYLLRTRVDVPADLAGRSFQLDLREFNLVATLFINGRRVGEEAIVYGFWTPDVTGFIRPGETNEIVLVMKDAFYALQPDNEGRSLRHHNYIPMSLFQQNQGTTMRLDFPVKGADETGILDGATLTASGPAYVGPTVVTTSVRDNRLVAEATLSYPGSRPLTVEVHGRVESWPDGGSALLTFPTRTVTLEPEGSETIRLEANRPESLDLWWPDRPRLHSLVIELHAGDRRLDTATTRFGFREWEVRGNQFYLNGLRWNFRADLTHYGAPATADLDAIRDRWAEHGQNMFRHRFQWDWAGMRNREALHWFDEVGMPVRQNIGSFDGQHASYNLRENNPALFDNWRRQMHSRVDRFRNHPSIFIWELDNEIIYINGRNLGMLDSVEPQFREASRQLTAKDPTRSQVIGGGNALRDQSLPTYGVHYFEVNDREYPNEAYTIEQSLARQNLGDGWNPWPIDFEAKPMFMGETAFLPGRNPAGFAAVGGEGAFVGKTEAQPAIATIGRWLAEGYRWRGVAAFQFWMGSDFAGRGYDLSFQPVAVFVREWNWTFGAGQSITRTLRVFNDTRHADPIEVEWRFEVEGRRLDGGSRTFQVTPGYAEEFVVDFTVPEVSERSTGGFTIMARRGGEEVFRETKPLHIINPEAGPLPEVDGELIVWDPSGRVINRLESRGIAFTAVAGMDAIPDHFGLLVVGPDAIPADSATDTRWLALAAAGNRMLILEQEHPLHFQAVPANFDLSRHVGRIAHLQNPSHPAFEGLIGDDFFVWADGEVVYKNPYRKPTTGAVSLVHCDAELGFTALAEAAVNEGLMVFCQLVVGDKLGREPAATRLFDNLLAYAAGYRLVRHPVALAVDPATPAGRMFTGLGMNATTTDDPLAAIRSGDYGVVVAQATPENLRRLAGDVDTVRAWCEAGGWLMIQGVAPETLADFNRLVGYEHLLRPFRMERVLLPPSPDPLTAGLSLADVVMSSGRRIQVHNRDEWPVDDAFDYVVDLDDIAPFSTLPPATYFKREATEPPGDDTWPENMVNGYLADTHWRMIFSIHLHRGAPTSWEVEFPREETVTGFSIVPNAIYHTVTRIRLTFDGDPATTQEFDLEGEGRQDFSIQPGVPARSMTIELADWDPRGTTDVIGVDNFWIRVTRPPEFTRHVRPLLNIGGLVRYQFGEGGILLNQYAILESESNPANAAKKQTVTATLLRNLGADFAGGTLVVPGVNMASHPVPLDTVANLYLTRPQGFPVGNADLGALPVGLQRFAGVDYLIRDFATSPLESGILLRHPRYRIQQEHERVEGIPVNRRADALFFLHTLLPGDTWRPSRDATEPPIIFEYTIHYADGTRATVPVELGLGIDSWLQNEPRPLRDAAVAWQAEGPRDQRITLYQMQWTNPHPDRTIRTIDLAYAPGGQRWGAPAVLAITVAEAR